MVTHARGDDPGTPASLETTDGPTAVRRARDLYRAGRHQEAFRWAAAVVDLSDDLAAWSGAARVAAQTLPHLPPLPRRVRVAVLGSSTSAQLAALLPLAAARAGIEIELYEGAYGQYQQDIRVPTSPLYAFAPDVVVLALHTGDLALPLVSEDPPGEAQRIAAGITELWDVLLETTSARILQFTMPEPPEAPLGHLAARLPGSRPRMVRAVNDLLAERAPAAVSFVDCARLAGTVGSRSWFDARYWHLAKQAVAPRHIPLLARHTAAVLAGALGASRKCVVLDLDNTLWGGVLGEDGIAGVRVGAGSAEGEAHAALQEHLLDLKRRGVVLAVCTKNDESLVRAAFDKIPGMRLRLADIAAISAGWDDKAAQIRRLAADLSLGLDALVFVDDNPVEREVVRSLVPEVDVLAMPEDPADYVQALSDYPWLETSAFTAEDGRRTDQYRARAEAAEMRSSSSSLEDFLDGLDMAATVSWGATQDLPRLAQLLGKTNQFNLTTRRHSEGDLAGMLEDPGRVVLAARLCDRFADHGLVALLIGEVEGGEFRIDTWLMSCRVIGRTLEEEMLTVAAREAASRGCTLLVGEYVPTAKNALVSDLYARLGFTRRPAPEGDGETWELPVEGVGSPPGHIRVSGPGPSTSAGGVSGGLHTELHRTTALP